MISPQCCETSFYQWDLHKMPFSFQFAFSIWILIDIMMSDARSRFWLTLCWFWLTSWWFWLTSWCLMQEGDAEDREFWGGLLRPDRHLSGLGANHHSLTSANQSWTSSSKIPPARTWWILQTIIKQIHNDFRMTMLVIQDHANIHLSSFVAFHNIKYMQLSVITTGG